MRSWVSFWVVTLICTIAFGYFSVFGDLYNSILYNFHEQSSPYTVDVKSKGFSLTAVPPAFASRFADPANVAMFGHTWYSDQCASAFVREATQKLTQPLFAFTGDHPSLITARNEKLEFAARTTVLPYYSFGPDYIFSTMDLRFRPIVARGRPAVHVLPQRAAQCVCTPDWHGCA